MFYLRDLAVPRPHPPRGEPALDPVLEEPPPAAEQAAPAVVVVAGLPGREPRIPRFTDHGAVGQLPDAQWVQDVDEDAVVAAKDQAGDDV